MIPRKQKVFAYMIAVPDRQSSSSFASRPFLLNLTAFVFATLTFQQFLECMITAISDFAVNMSDCCYQVPECHHRN